MTTKPETRATMLEALKAADFAGALTCCCPNDKWFTCWACKARAAIAEAEQTDSRATPTKQLLLTEVIERYPRMLKSLKELTASIDVFNSTLIEFNVDVCISPRMQAAYNDAIALLAEIERCK